MSDKIELENEVFDSFQFYCVALMVCDETSSKPGSLKIMLVQFSRWKQCNKWLVSSLQENIWYKCFKTNF